MHSDFLAKCGDGLHLPTDGNSDQHNVIVLDVQEEGQSQSIFHALSEQFGLRGLKLLNFQGIAKVCQTDVNTVELILKEIVATIVSSKVLKYAGSPRKLGD
jgi:hypothetical protein